MVIKLVSILLFLCFASGCTYGWLYTDTIEPLCVDMDKTSVGDKTSISSLKEVALPRVPFASTRWSSKAIGDAAKEQGIKKVHYCDTKRYRLLGGLWSSDSVVVYGE